MHRDIVKVDDSSCVVSVVGSKVVGVSGATIAMLTQLGWDLSSLRHWVCPRGVTYRIDTETCPIRHSLEIVEASAGAKIWRNAVDGPYGGGLQDGILHDETFAWLAQLKAREEFAKAALLETWLVGGAWTEERCFEAGLSSSSICTLCHGAPQSMTHLLYACPSLGQIGSEEVDSTQGLAAIAVEGSRLHPAFWLRGLLPASSVSIPRPLVYSSLALCRAALQPTRW